MMTAMSSRPSLVWDLPTRLTHWLFVGCVAFSWWSAEERLMDWHRYSGYTMLGLLVFRVYWGIAGSSTALAMLVQVTLGLFATDIDGLESGPLSHLVSFDGGRTFAEAHELSFDVLIVLIAVHIVAVVFHLLYDRNNLTGPMLNGRKHVGGESSEMRRASLWRLWTGVAFATLVVWMVVKG
jgi:cytochrome b